MVSCLTLSVMPPEEMCSISGDFGLVCQCRKVRAQTRLREQCGKIIWKQGTISLFQVKTFTQRSRWESKYVALNQPNDPIKREKGLRQLLVKEVEGVKGAQTQTAWQRYEVEGGDPPPDFVVHRGLLGGDSMDVTNCQINDILRFAQK